MNEHGTSLTRRQAIGATGAAGAALFLAKATGAGRLFDALDADSAQAATTCTLTPSKTEGPYFVDEKLNRSDIRTDPSDGSVQDGVPLALEFLVLRSDGDCAPVSGATVDVWHANADGRYSDESANGTSGKKYLRGYQATGSDGKAGFTTIYPGWYQGRTVHIHFKIRLFDGSSETYEFTSQLFFDPSVTNEVVKTEAYRSKGSPDTTNSSDGIYGNDGSKLLVTLQSDGNGGYKGTFVVGLSGLPAGAGSGTTAGTVSAALSATRFKRTASGARLLRVTVAADESVTATARLARSGSSIARRKVSLRSGTRAFYVKVPRRTAGGSAELVLRMVNADGASKVATKTVTALAADGSVTGDGATRAPGTSLAPAHRCRCADPGRAQST